MITRALELYGGSRRLDFVDAYLAALALTGESYGIASLDYHFDRIEGARRLSS